jgi:hypothetical protein
MNLGSVWALCVVASAALLGWLWLPPPAHADTTRDFLLALDCLKLGRCGIGPHTSLLGFAQGSLWVRAVAFALGCADPIEALRQVVVMNHALAFATIFTLLRLQFSLRAAIFGGLSLLAVSVWDASFAVLWNPDIAPLPLALFWVGVWLVAKGIGGGVSCTLLGVAAGLAIDAHLVNVLLFPALAAVPCLAAARPRQGVSLALGSALSVHALLSPVALVGNAAFAGVWGCAALAAAIAAAGVVASWARPSWTRWSPARRLEVLVVISCAPFVLALLASAVGGRHLAPRYGLALVPIVAAVIGAALERRRWVGPAWLVVLTVACAALHDGFLTHGPTRRLPELARVVRAASTAGLVHALPIQIQGPGCGDAVEAFDALAPVAVSFRRWESMQLLFAPSAPPRTSGPAWVALGSAYARPWSSWIATPDVELCEDGRCGKLVDGKLGGYAPLIRRTRVREGHGSRVRLPITIGAGGERFLQIWKGRPNACPWHATTVEGDLKVDRLGADHVILRGHVGAHGWLSLEPVPGCAATHGEASTPCVLETTPEEGALRSWVAALARTNP